MRNILILGGTGAMGKHIVDLLNAAGDSVFVTSRTTHNNYGNITYLKGNAKDEVFVEKILHLQEWDVIVDFMIYQTDEFQNRYEKLLSSCKQYVFLSSSRVYADTQPSIIESSPRLLDICDDLEYLATEEYALSKAREENLLIHSPYSNWTIIRPYITYSENRLQLGVLEKEYWLYQAVHKRTIVFSKDIAEKTTTLTYGYDVAQGINSIIGRKEAFGKVFHITVDESHTWQEIFDVYLRVLTDFLGCIPKVKMIDKNPRMNIPSSKWQVVYDRYYNRRFDNTAINQFVDTTTFRPTLEGVENCLRSFLKNPTFYNVGWGEHAMYDRITGEWTPFKEIPTWKQRIVYLLRRTILPKR